MSILSRIFQPAQEARALDYDEQIWRGVVPETASGVVVTEQTAMQLSAVYACVRILSESVASLPLVLYERANATTKQRAVNRRLYGLLHDLPNPEVTAFEMRETLMAHLALRGNAYCEIERDNSGQVLYLWPLRPDRMTVERDEASGELIYKYRVAGEPDVPLAASQVWHLRGLSMAGVVGISPIAQARQAVGLAVAAEEFGARFFSNGARPSGVLTHPGALSDPAYTRLRDSWQEVYGGLSNAQRVAILEEGVGYQQISVAPEDAQFLETRKFQLNEIARIFRVPPHMLADLDRATFSNIEHQSLEFVMHTLRPWLVRIEQSISKDLILPRERGRYYAEHLVEGLLRGDVKSRYEAYSIGRNNGWLSANDVREKENMNPIEGGDEYLVPLNMVPAGAERQLDTGERRSPTAVCDCGHSHEHGQNEQRGVGQGETAMATRPEQRAAAGDRQRLAQAQMSAWEDMFARVVRREVQDVSNAARRFGRTGDLGGFRAWLGAFWEEHKEFYSRNMSPLLETYAALVADAVGRELGELVEAGEIGNFIESYATGAAVRHVARHEASVNGYIERAEAEAWDTAVVESMAEWVSLRPAAMANEETVRGSNALALAFYGVRNILNKTWVAFGENCPFCDALNGQSLRIDAYFIPAGGELEAGGSILNVSGNIGHPPAHGGCDCMIVAG